MMLLADSCLEMTDQLFQRLWWREGGSMAATCQSVISGLHFKICKNFPVKVCD